MHNRTSVEWEACTEAGFREKSRWDATTNTLEKVMRAWKAFLVGLGFLLACSTARADLVVDVIGDIKVTDSWNWSVSFLPGGFDLVTAEVLSGYGEAFVASPSAGVSILDPATSTPLSGWASNTYHSASLVSTTGTALTSTWEADLHFAGNGGGLGGSPLGSEVVEVRISAWLPGYDAAAGSMTFVLGDGSVTQPFGGGAPTGVTRSSLVAAPVPGAVFLGALGLGFVGFMRKRLA